MMHVIKINDSMPLRMGGRFSQSTGWEHSGRMLNNCLMVCVEEGSCTFVINGRVAEVNSGQGILIPAHTLYAPRTQSGCCYLYFRFEAQAETAEDLPFMGRSYHYSEHIEPSCATFCLPEIFQMDAMIRFQLETIIEEMTRSDPASNVKMNMAFFQMLIRLTEQTAGQVAHSLAFEMERYIRENATHNLTLSQLAERFGYTKQYVIRIFKKQFHTTPTAFINDTKLMLAIRHLTESDRRIEDIAHRCGFEDANYFSRQFKRKYHISPSDYRRQSPLDES